MLASSALLSTTADGRWHPSIGDPSLVGWITVLAYVTAALLAARSARAHGRPAAQADVAEARLLARFWWALACALLALGINKQLDLQTLFTQVLRDLAQAQGWYERRRPYQVAFIAAIAVVGSLGTALLAYSLRRVVRRVWLAVLGVGLLVSFVMIRAASIHQIDVLLKQGAVRLNWILELGSVSLIGLSALRELRRAPAREAARNAPLGAAQLPEVEARGSAREPHRGGKT
jgi:hypothetical protein